MRPAHTPSSVKGSISKCVVSLERFKKKPQKNRYNLLDINLNDLFILLKSAYHVPLTC